MTDEEKACKYICDDTPCRIMCEKAECYLAGIAEGRKELEKEIAELKAEVSDIKTAIRNYSKAKTYQQQEITWNSLLEFIN